MKFHALAGLPRSGSTLLANVLSQHPDVHVSSTSCLAHAVEMVGDVLSSSAEVQSDLANEPGAQEKYRGALRGLIEGWYAQREEPVVIDKGRGWAMHRLLLDQLFPGSTMILTVRDPRNVVASIERQHRRTAMFNSSLGRTIYEAAEALMAPDGMVGGPCRHIEDLVRRGLGGVHFVPYETLVRDPVGQLHATFDVLGLPGFTPDVANVEDHATDQDALYFGKFPHHDAVGQIKPTATSWEDVMDDELAGLIAGRYPLYMATFGYGAKYSPARSSQGAR